MDGLKYDVVEIQSQANMFAFWYGLVVGSDLNFFWIGSHWDPEIYKNVTISRPELKTFVLDKVNPDFLIFVSTVDTYDFMLNPLFWISLLDYNQWEFAHWLRGENFKISRLLIGCFNHAINTLIGWILYTFRDTS